MKSFKKGAKVAYCLVGWGITNYEGPDVITDIRDGRIFTETYDKYGFEWDEARKAWRFSDGFSDLKSTLVALEDADMYRFLEENAKGDEMLQTLLSQVKRHRATLAAGTAPAKPVAATSRRSKAVPAKAVKSKTKVLAKKKAISKKSVTRTPRKSKK
jgi:hypothetical protein